MTVDRYARSGERWATGASLVYRPIADLLIDRCRHPLAGRLVLDAGAGTGVASDALVARGARAVAADFSQAMLAWGAASRPPAAVADVTALPVARDSVDDTVAAFVLNHLSQPQAGLLELQRVTRRGGAVLACVYSNNSRSAVRDQLDELARARGWQTPAWYVEMKASVVPLLGGRSQMTRAADAIGLDSIEVEETPVDVGVTTPEQLVEYRLGQAHFADWLDEIGPARGAEIRAELADGIHEVMEPYRPIVVFLSAVVR